MIFDNGCIHYNDRSMFSQSLCMEDYQVPRNISMNYQHNVGGLEQKVGRADHWTHSCQILVHELALNNKPLEIQSLSAPDKIGFY